MKREKLKKQSEGKVRKRVVQLEKDGAEQKDNKYAMKQRVILEKKGVLKEKKEQKLEKQSEWGEKKRTIVSTSTKKCQKI